MATKYLEQVMALNDQFALEALEARVLLDANSVAPGMAMSDRPLDDVVIVESAVNQQATPAEHNPGASGSLEEAWLDFGDLADLGSDNPTNQRSGSATVAGGAEGPWEVRGADMSDGIPDRPLLLLHGIGGSMPSVANYPEWVMRRGFDPNLLIQDPLMGYYGAIMEALDLNGYTPSVGPNGTANRNADLWAANYDWRSAPGPFDGTHDGVIRNEPGSALAAQWGPEIQATQITDDSYDYGIDALGYWLLEASFAWANGHGGVLPETIDVIAHSTGGLVVRSYIQSSAYGGELSVSFPGNGGFLPNGDRIPLGLKNPDGTLVTVSGKIALPKINRMITVGVPMRGAASPYLLAQDDWGSDISYEYLSKIVTQAYVNYQAGQDIEGPSGTTIRGFQSGLNNRLSPTEFIALYCPTFQALTATYPFIDDTTVAAGFNLSKDANNLAIDLNDGLDLYFEEGDIGENDGVAYGLGTARRPAAFADLLLDGLTVIYNGQIATANGLRLHSGPEDYRETGDFGVTPFWENGKLNPAQSPGPWYDVWYTENTVDPIKGMSNAGDGAVPEKSAIGLYRGVGNNNMGVLLVPKVELVELTDQESTHTGMLLSDPGQRAILTALGFSNTAVLSELEEYWGSVLPKDYLGWNGSKLTATPFGSAAVPADPNRVVIPLRRAKPAADEPFVIPVLLADQLEQVARVFDALSSNVLSGITDAVELAEDIPLLGASMVESLTALEDQITGMLAAAASAVRALPSGSSVEALADALRNVGVLAKGTALRITETYVELAIDLTSIVTKSLVASLGEAAGAYAVSLINPPAVSGDQYLRMQARIRIDLALAQTATAQAIAISQYSTTMAMVAKQTALAGSVQFGSNAPTTHSDSALDVEAYVTQDITDPQGGDAGITVDEMTSRTGAEQSAIQKSGRGRMTVRSESADRKVVFANTSRPIGVHPDVFIDSINFALIKDKLREMLDQLAILGDAMEDPTVQVALHIPLPFLDDPDNNTLDEILTEDKTGFGLDEFFTIVDILRKYCDEVRNPNLADFIDRVLRFFQQSGGDGPHAHGPFSIGGGFDATGVGFNLVFKVDLSRTQSFTLTEEGLGAEADALGLDLSIPVDGTVTFSSEFAIGMDLGGLLSVPSTGLSRNQVTLDFNKVAVDFALNAPDIDATVTIGFLNAGIVDGSASMTLGVDVAVNGNNPMTLAQLQTSPGSPWIRFSPSPEGTLTVNLPIRASLGGTDLTAGCSPTITITDGNLFDSLPPQVKTNDFDCISSFCSMTPAQALASLKGLGDWLEQFRDSSVFDVGIPFTSGTDLGDVFDVSKAFVDKVYYQLAVREIVPVGAQTEEIRTLGRFSGNASFQLSLDNGPPVLVTVPHSSTAANQSHEDLVADFNAALSTAGLVSSVEAAINGGGRFSIRLKKSSTTERLKLTVPDPDGSASTPNTNPMVAELGFSETQFSVENPDFNNIEEFSDDISQALARAGIPLNVNLRWDAADEAVRMDVSYTSAISRSASFRFDPDLAMGPLLDVSASGSIALNATLGARFTLGLDFSPEETPRLQTGGLVPPPSSGRLTADARFTLKVDSDRYDLTLLESSTATNASLADLVADINALFTAGNTLREKVVAEVQSNAIVLKVVDAKLGVHKSIQLIGANDSTFFTEVGFGNGDSNCGASVGLFVEDMVLAGALTISASDLEASLRVGVFSVSLSRGYADGTGSFNLSIQAPDGTLRFNLEDLFAAAPDFGGLLKIAPKLTASIDIRLPNLVISPALIDIPTGSEIRIYVPDIHVPEYSPEPFDATLNPKGLFVTLPSIGGLSNFNCLTYLDIIQGIQELADELEGLQGFGFLGSNIPLLNLSIGDILDYAGNLAEMVEGLATGNVDTIETLERDIEDFLNVSNRRLINLTVEDFTPPALADGGAGVLASARFNPSGDANAIEFRARAVGSQYNGAVIEFVDDGRYAGVVDDALVEWSEANKRLRIYYHSGFTTAQTVVTKVQALAGSPVTAVLDTRAETGGTGPISLTALKFSLQYNLAYGSFHTLDLGFEEFLGMLNPDDPAIASLGGIDKFVQLEATGSLNVSASADLLIEFGIDVSNPCKWSPFLYDTTHLTLAAAIRGTDIELTAAVGALGIFAKDGSVTVDRDGDPTTTGDGEDAMFVVGFKGLDLDGRYYFRDGLDFLSDVTVTVEAGAGAELTLCFPTADIPLGSTQDSDGNGFPDNTLVLRIPDLGTLFGRGKAFVDIGGGQFEVLLPCLGPNNDLRLVTSDVSMAVKKVRLVNLTSGAPRVEVTADSILIHVDSGVTTLSALLSLSTPQLTFSASVTTEASGANTGAGKVCSSVDLTLPNLSSILNAFNACDLITNAPLLLDGLDVILGIIQDGLQSEVLSRNMPLVGAQLSKAGNFIEDFREGLLTDIRTKLASVGDPIQLVREAIWNVLGKPGLNLLDTSIGSATDVDVDCVVGGDGQMEIVFNLDLGKTISLIDTSKNPIDIDIGIPGLGLDIDGNVVVELGWSFDFRFGISSRDGFFLETDIGHPELEVYFAVTVPGLSASGELIFLGLKVADESDGKDANGNNRKSSSFIGAFSVDLQDPNGDGRLSFGEMTGGGFDLGDFFVISLDAKAEVHLDLEVNFADDARFPRILVEFDMVWCWAPTDSETAKGDLEFGFNNIQIDLGQFISKFIIPILDEIQVVTKPLEPIIDILTARLPIFSDLAGEDQTLLDLAELAGLLKPGTVKFIESLGTIADLANQFSVFNGKTIWINVGGFLLEEDPLGNIDPFAPLEEYEIHPEEETSDADAKGFFNSLKELGITFPFLKLSELFKLLTGQPVSIVEYHMPVLEFEASIKGQIPIFPPLYIIFGGAVGAKIDLTFGFDTYGIQKYSQSKDKNIADIFEGFYVKDKDDYGVEIPELTLSGGLFAGAEIDLLVAEVGVTGGIFADVFFDLRDPDDDGRIRALEILENIKESPLCLFDVSGRLYVALDAFLKVDLLILSVDKQWRFGEITLAEFSIDTCPVPVLASFDTNGNGEETETEVNSGELVLHMGEFAALRKHGDTADGNERFTVRSITSISGGSQTVEVSYGGYKQTYAGVKSIRVEAGKGNDVVDLSGVGVSATVYGGDGDDEILATRGGGIYRGDSGNDVIEAEEASEDFAGGTETFYGGSGNDQLFGFEGDDFLYGDDGDDEIFGGDGVDTADGGNGNDQIFGEAGNDTVAGGSGADELMGADGNDTLIGGEGDDTLDGGNGDDKLTGQAGNDSLDGGSDDDVLVGDEGRIVSLLQVTGISGDGNDVLAGGAGDDTLIGGGGNDSLFGGNHLVSGRTTAVGVGFVLTAGSLVAQSDGADFLDGGEGNDVLIADDGHSGQVSTFPGAEVGDVVWLDLNENGIQDPGEPGLSGVRVQIHRASDFVMLGFAMTDRLGTFRFAGLPTGDYYLLLTAPLGTTFTLSRASSSTEENDSNFADADNNGTAESETFHLDAGEKRTDLDAGIIGGTPTLSISDASITEGDTGLAYLVFTVSLSSPSSQVVTVGYKTGIDSDAATQNALAGLDFKSTEYTLVFEPGAVSKEVRVAVVGDLKDELNEVVQVTLVDAFQYTTPIPIADDKGFGTILNDDDAPVATISDVFADEPGTTGPTLTFTVELSNPSWQTLKLDWVLQQVTNSDGSLALDAAVVGTDYVDASGSLTFGEDVVSRTFTVTLAADSLDEYDERFLAVLSKSATTPVDGVVLGDDSATGTIVDNDAMPFVTIRGATGGAITEGHAGNRPVELKIELSAVSGRSVTVNWNTTRGTAIDSPTLTESADFVDTFETVTFLPGEISKAVYAYIIGDTVKEGVEHFFANLLTSVNGEIGASAANPNHAVINISEDESGDQGPWYIQFSDANYTVTEGGNAVITLVRAGNSSHPVAVYWISGGTATPGVDYDGQFNPTSGGQRGIVHFGAGETIQTFEIETYDNQTFSGQSIYEGNETILLQLANPQGGPVRGEIKSATVTIVEDDPMPVLTISDAPGAAHLALEKSSSGVLGALTFTVTLTGTTSKDVTVSFASISGSATAELDFTSVAGVLTFNEANNWAPQTITVKLKDDVLLEDYEDLFVVLSNPVNAIIGDYTSDSDATGGEDSDDRGFGLILDNEEAASSGYVYFDANGNGFRDAATDFGYSSITVTWTNILDNTVLDSGMTDLNGLYSISLPLGDYSVTVTETLLPSGSSPTSYILPYTLSFSATGMTLDLGYALPAATELPSDSSGSGTTGNNDTAYGGSGSDVLSGGAGNDWLVGGHWLGPGCSCEGLSYDVTLKELLDGSTRTRVYVDPASLPAPGVISGRVWVDSNLDNTESGAVGLETGLRNVQVNLYDLTWVLVATTYTDQNGNYSFGNLTACDYRAQVLPPGGYSLVTKGVGSAARNSDADPVTGLTDAVAVAVGETKLDIDIGLVQLPDGVAPWNVSFAFAIYSVRESDGFALIELKGDGNTSHPTAVYFMADGTAVDAVDYLGLRRAVRLGSGETLDHFVVPIIADDNDAEGYETVLLYLKNPQGGPVRGSQPAAVLLIFDNPCPDDDEIDGGEGTDTLLGDFGYFSDTGVASLLGGMGNDLLKGGEGDDTIYGEGGNDQIEGGTGDDFMDGGSENDLYMFDTDETAGSDEIVEGTAPLGGSDTLDFSTTALSVVIDLTGSTLVLSNNGATVLDLLFTANQIENVTSGSGNDTLRGNASNNILRGGAGDDILEGRGGNDQLDGGIGNDTYLFDADFALGADEIFEASNRDTDTIDFVGTTLQAVSVNIGTSASQIVAPTLSLTITTAPSVAMIGGFHVTLIMLNPFTGEPMTSDVSTAIENLYGGSYAPGTGVQDRLTGNSRDNVIWGREGNDVLDGGTSGYDTLTETRAGNWQLTASTVVNATTGESDSFTAGSFDEIALTGDDNANLLDASSFSGLVRLAGAGGDDTLIGGSGTNYLSGGLGSDIVNGSLGYDILTEARDANMTLSNSSLLIGVESDTLIGVIEEAHLTGGLGSNQLDSSLFVGVAWLHGDAGDDFLVAGVGDDFLEGGDGTDVLAGGMGNDTYLFDAEDALGIDQLSESPGGGIDWLDFSPTTSLGVTVSLATTTVQVVNSNLSLVLNALEFENLRGSRADDILSGNSLANVIEGVEGSDRITGDTGSDTLAGGDGLNSAGYAYTDVLVERRNANSVVLDGGSLSFGGLVEDLISGFERAELSGGGGDNRINASLFTGSVRLSGEGGNDTLIGGSFDDVLIGGGGNDDLRGGTGNDTYEFDADLALGTDVIRDTGGIDWLDFGSTTEFAIRISLISTALQVVNSNLTVTLASSTDMDNLRGGSKNDSLTGNDGDNIIDGGDGDDTINGLDGEDLFLGGNGDDTYVFDLSATDPIGLKTLLEDVGSGGIDTLRFNGTSAISATISLATGSEQSVHSSLDLTLVRSHSIENVIGTLGNDIITGNSLDNRIEGRGGNDTIAGGLGNDVYVFDADTALGTDTLTEDPVEGGNDTMDFGPSAAGVGTSVAPLSLNSTALQTVNAFLSLTLSSTTAFENAIGGSGADFIQGNNQDNLLKGGAGDDTLNGLVGNDRLEGEGGNDMLAGGVGDDDYLFGDSASGSDILTEAVNGGVDTVDFSQVALHALTFGLNVSTAQTLWTGVAVTLSGADRFESLAGGALDDVLTGNTLDNFIGGGSGNDRLLGRGGADSLAGGPGDDTYEFGVGAGNDLITELAGEGSDTIDFSGLGFPLEALWASSLLITFVDASFVTHSISHAFDYVETLIGGSAADHVTTIPSLNTAFDFTGGAGLGDVLTFVTGGEAAVQTAGRIELPGFKAVTHRGFETIELQEALP